MHNIIIVLFKYIIIFADWQNIVSVSHKLEVFNMMGQLHVLNEVTPSSQPNQHVMTRIVWYSEYSNFEYKFRFINRINYRYRTNIKSNRIYI